MYFIWDGKLRQIGIKHLQKPKALGGLALQNDQTYYWAANFRALLYWLQTDPTGPRPLWVQIEFESCKPAALSSVLCPSLPVSLGKRCVNLIVKQSLKMWNQFRLAFEAFLHQAQSIRTFYFLHLFKGCGFWHLALTGPIH